MFFLKSTRNSIKRQSTASQHSFYSATWSPNEPKRRRDSSRRDVCRKAASSARVQSKCGEKAQVDAKEAQFPEEVDDDASIKVGRRKQAKRDKHPPFRFHCEGAFQSYHMKRDLA